jgi:hypothetical protein
MIDLNDLDGLVDDRLVIVTLRQPKQLFSTAEGFPRLNPSICSFVKTSLEHALLNGGLEADIGVFGPLECLTVFARAPIPDLVHELTRLLGEFFTSSGLQDWVAIYRCDMDEGYARCTFCGEGLAPAPPCDPVDLAHGAILWMAAVKDFVAEHNRTNA